MNPPQREAVLATEGPVLVLAGAGTGKTAALTARLAHLIATRLAWPSQILAVTFTNKAAREMKDRVAALRKAMLDTINDPAMVADAGKMKIELDPVPGEETVQIFEDFYKTPPDLVKKAAAMTQPEQK